MKFYVTPPLANLDLINLGDRSFCLAQHYVNNEDYRKFFLDQKAQGRFITLDSGVGDHSPVSEKDLMYVVKELMPNEAIPRDVLDNSEATLRGLQTFIDEAPPSVGILACPQGRTVGQYIDTFGKMMFNPNVTRVAMSKLSTVKVLYGKYDDALVDAARPKLFSCLHIMGFIRKPIHLLGIGAPRGLMKYLSHVQSADSCAPIWSAMNSISYTPFGTERIPTPRDYFTRSMTEEQVILARSNIDFLKTDKKLQQYINWCRYGYPEETKPQTAQAIQGSLF